MLYRQPFRVVNTSTRSINRSKIPRMKALMFVLASWISIAYPRKSGPYRVCLESIETLVTDPSASHIHFQLTTYNRYEKLASAAITFFRNVGPLGIKCDNYITDGATGWRNAYKTFENRNMCVMRPWIQPFFNHFSGELTNFCTISKGKYTLTNWTVGENIKAFAGDTMFYGRYKTEAYFTDGDCSKHIIGFNVTYSILDADLLEHQMKVKKKGHKEDHH